MAVWEVSREEREVAEDIYFSMSTDGGTTWMNEVKVNDNGTDYRCFSPSIATDGTNVYITWGDRRNGDYDIYFDWCPISNIDFNGVDTRVNSDVTGRSQTTPSITTDGTNVYIAWTDDRIGGDEEEDIYFDLTPVAGIDFNSEDVLVNNDGEGNYQSNPSITSDGSNIYIVWEIVMLPYLQQN